MISVRSSLLCVLALLFLDTGAGVCGFYMVPGRWQNLNGTTIAVGNNTSTKVARDVWAPKITEPNTATVWNIGSKVKVSWDVTHPPEHVTNYNGKLLLGYLDSSDDSNENLDYKNPLAEGFNLTKGHVVVKVPNVSPSNDYIVVLMGDSGNRSPTFTITS
ncbi:hypothetical protein A0H81_00785 [Grifola frondosa]|uniref:Fibronectin type-III domain-containing protein n=1 Tax=Grifola frondosa TaxID=5627 RepID=A0A1C7MPL0_GRIFR|nr:hypothetical protein A0H81_00785 [Grifola frondosa]